jgi:hypothetical protein
VRLTKLVVTLRSAAALRYLRKKARRLVDSSSFIPATYLLQHIHTYSRVKDQLSNTRIQYEMSLVDEDPCRTESKNRDNEVAPILSHILMVQEPTEVVKASIPTKNVRDGPNLNRTVTVRRRAKKRALPWDLTARDIYRVTPPQAEDTPARKKPRREEPLPATTDEAARKTPLPDISVGLPAAADDDHADADSVKGARATGHWRLEEDAKLRSAVAIAGKKKYGKEYRTDWAGVAALVPGRTRSQCWSRWTEVLDPNIDRASGRTGKWTAVEDSKLKDAVQTHGGRNWAAIASLVPGRAQIQCRSRWHNVLDANSDRTPGRTGKWTEDEVIKLKAAVQTHGDKNWGAVAALVAGRTKSQCLSRWKNVLDPKIDRASGRTGKWTAAEVIKLEAAVQMYGGKDWAAIAALVPGRTRSQCWSRWKDVLDPNAESGHTGKWTAVEDSKLKDAVQMHGGKDWAAIASLVPGRAQIQCRSRWHNFLIANLDRTPARTGTWTEDEVIKLKAAVQTHGDKNWGAIAALVPGRTRSQCLSRWKNVLDPNDRASGRTGKWTEEEDLKLKNSVKTHGGKNWYEIASLVPGRTQKHCSNRWHDFLDPSIDRVDERTGKWTSDEDKQLKDAVQTHGGKSWGEIAALIPGRTKIQCSSRWHGLGCSIGRANGRTGKWTSDEVIKLKDAIQTHGDKDWVAISALVPGRTKKQCWDRWKKHMDPNRTNPEEVEPRSLPVTLPACSDTVHTYVPYGYL